MGSKRPSRRPFPCECGGDYKEIMDSRPFRRWIQRRRECAGCGARISTYEVRGEPGAMQASGSIAADVELGAAVREMLWLVQQSAPIKKLLEKEPK